MTLPQKVDRHNMLLPSAGAMRHSDEPAPAIETTNAS
jgi:hypothetical protein